MNILQQVTDSSCFICEIDPHIKPSIYLLAKMAQSNQGKKVVTYLDG